MNLFSSRSTITLEVEPGRQTNVLLINLNKDVYHTVLELNYNLRGYEGESRRKHSVQCISLYRQIFKLLTIYSCPGQWVAFNVILPNGVLYRVFKSESRLKHGDNHDYVPFYRRLHKKAKIVFNGGENQLYTLIKHYPRMGTIPDFNPLGDDGYNCAMEVWYINRAEERKNKLEKLTRLVRYIMKKIQESPRKTLTHEDNTDQMFVFDYGKTLGKLIVVSSEEPHDGHCGEFVMGFAKEAGLNFISVGFFTMVVEDRLDVQFTDCGEFNHNTALLHKSVSTSDCVKRYFDGSFDHIWKSNK